MPSNYTRLMGSDSRTNQKGPVLGGSGDLVSRLIICDGIINLLTKSPDTPSKLCCHAERGDLGSILICGTVFGSFRMRS